MLPRTHLLAILSFLVEMSVSSPVYNMQPAYITATIGSTGRNIRNLPCISRKSNQSGVCMFAIDCLKANGTHLGTCIDRFYFGSCCHIEPLQDITENTIDAALIPSREPPHRITSTNAPTTIAISSSSTTNATQMKQDLPVTTTQQQVAIQTTTTQVSHPASASSTADDLESYKITTFQSVDDVPVTTTARSTSAKPTPAKTKPTTTAIPVQTTKPTTKVTKPRPQTTPKPSPTYINRNTTQQLNATRITTPRTRPRPTKPVKITKPIYNTTATFGSSTSSLTPTPAPNVQKTTLRSSTTTRATKLTKKPTLVTKATVAATKKPIISTTSRLPVTVTTNKPSTATIKTTTKLTTIPTSTTSTTSTLSNEVLVAVNATINDTPQKDHDVNGNPATNEIESHGTPSTTTTSGPSLVTWSEINKNNSVFNASQETISSTRPASSTSSEDVTNPDDWVPVTDGWVLLPSLTTTQESNDIATSVSSSSTEKSEESSSEASLSSSSTEANQPSHPSSPTTSTQQLLTSFTESSTSYASSSSTSTEYISSSSSEDSSSSSSTEDAAGTAVTAATDVTPTPIPVATSGINMSDFTDVCGRRMVPEGRIVGGEKSAFGKWPWQISLRQWRTSTYLHKCGAALLNENWAITAAHCVDNVPPSDLLLRLGEHDLSTEAEPYLHQERRVQIVASHPQFDPRTFEYDLALLRFYEPVTFQPNILPVCVPSTDENFVGRNAHVTGWGRLYEDGPLPSVLQEVSVPVINNTVCESMYRSAGYIEHIPNIFICAGWRRGGFDSCEGDSGGPMVIQRTDKRFILAGVISWGIGCAEPNQPGVYTRISEFRDWINQILQF